MRVSPAGRCTIIPTMKKPDIPVVVANRPLRTIRLRPGLARREVIALLLLIPLAYIVWINISGWNRDRVHMRRLVCLDSIKQIQFALDAYREKNADHWPFIEKLRSTPVHNPPWPSMSKVFSTYIDPQVLRCPADTRTLADDSPLLAKFGRKTTWFETEGTSYEWMFSDALGGRKVGDEAFGKAARVGKADLTLLRDFEAFHTGDDSGTFNTLNADMKVRTARVSRTKK